MSDKGVADGAVAVTAINLIRSEIHSAPRLRPVERGSAVGCARELDMINQGIPSIQVCERKREDERVFSMKLSIVPITASRKRCT